MRAKNTSKQPSKQPSKQRRAPAKARIETAIQTLLDKWEAGAQKGGARVSVSDFIRLLQLQKELKAERRPKEIKVTWIEPEEKDPDPED